MTLYDWAHLFLQEVRETDVWQWAAVAFGVAEVLLAKANSIWLYPTGIIATVLGLMLLYDAKLYAESALNLYYIIMSVYGWIHWLRRKGEPQVSISYANRGEWIITGLIAISGCGVLYLVLSHFTNSDVPFWDAFVSSTAWAGMWLLARRKIENWVLLNISNFFAVPLLFYKRLPLFAALTVFLFIVAVIGYLDWARSYKKAHAGTRITS
jgi:nicotinamide mononucleotide transporter